MIVHRGRITIRLALGLLLILALIAAAGCGGDDDEGAGAVTVEMATEPMSDADADAVDRAVTDIWEANEADLPALYVGVWDPEKGVFTKAYGDASEGVPATTEDSVRIGSISKSYTANVVLQLVADGRLSLDDTIQEVAPDVAESFPTVADRTIRQLLDMHSGISDYLNSEDGLVADIVAEPDRVWDPDELIAKGIELGVVPAGEPGGYSTSNYILLQEVVEELTGSSLADLVKADVTDRLGLESTFLPPNDDTALPEPAAHSLVTPSCRSEFVESGADVDVGTDVTDWNASYGQGGGGMTSTLGDLGTWAASGTGDVLLPDDLAKERNRTAKLGDGLEYGLGLLRLGGWYGHEGEALGWETIALRNPESGVSVALAANSCGVIGQFAQILGALYPEIPLQD